MSRRLAITVAAIALGACAWGPGEPFAEIDARLAASWSVPADRELDDGWIQLASDYQVRIDSFALTGAEIALVDTGGASATFDPADPPPGYSNCHNGHCHAADGGLVSYEEIQAELSGDTGAAEVILLPIGTLDLVAGFDQALPCVPRGCTLPLAHVTLARLSLTAVAMSGRVRDGRLEPRFDGERDFELAVQRAPQDPLELLGRLDLAADREADPRIDLRAILDVSPAIFDAVDWATAVPETGPLDLNENDEATGLVLDELIEVPLTIDIQREGD